MSVESPRLIARLTGVFALLEAATGVFGQLYVPRALLVRGSAAGTVANIVEQKQLFWAGFSSALLAVAFHVVWVTLSYRLLRPVNRTVSLLAAFVGVVACSLQGVAVFFQLAPIAVVDGARYLESFTPAQLESLALLLLHFNARAYNIYLVFFGFWCLLIGCLIYQSTFLPRLIGVLEAVAGLAWLTLLSPPLAKSLGSLTMILAAPGELSLLLWLLIVGVNEAKWNEKAGAFESGGVASALQLRSS